MTCPICDGTGKLLTDTYDIRDGEHVQIEQTCECKLLDVEDEMPNDE